MHFLIRNSKNHNMKFFLIHQFKYWNTGTPLLYLCILYQAHSWKTECILKMEERCGRLYFPKKASPIYIHPKCSSDKRTMNDKWPSRGGSVFLPTDPGGTSATALVNRRWQKWHHMTSVPPVCPRLSLPLRIHAPTCLGSSFILSLATLKLPQRGDHLARA